MKKTAPQNHWRLLIALLLIFFIFAFLPLPAELQSAEDARPVPILDRHGEVLYEYRRNALGTQDYLNFEEIPPLVITTVLAVEDRNFFRHRGVSLKAILRAAWQNFQAGKIVSGGSTITQQLVKNKLEPKSRDYLYKLHEAYLALKLETRNSKSEILEEYLNSVYFGHQAYGIGAASQVFFEKNPDELSLAEVSFLAGLVQSPSAYDPYLNYDRAKNRQKTVLKSLGDMGLLSDAQIATIHDQEIKLGSGRVQIHAPHFVMWTVGDLQESATDVRTTLDLDLQQETEQIIRNKLEELEDQNVTSAAVVVMDVENGDILAMAGSANYFDAAHDGQVNVALSPRQPGSALKPFTYALALEGGDTAASTVADIETQFFTQDGNPYTPRNYDYGYHGLVRYREALANSYNIAAVKVLEKVGVQRLLSFLKKAGIRTLDQSPEYYGLALTLGSGEVKLLELTQAYCMLARGGLSCPYRRSLKQDLPESHRILDERVAWLITDILDDDEARLPEFGSRGPLEFSYPVAAKTGTTRNSRDNWTLGYSPEVVVGVWVGNADNSPMRNTSGVTGAGPIFHDVMNAAMRHRPKRDFERPYGIRKVEVCKLSGKKPTEFCPHTVFEWFIAGTEPKKADDIFQPIALDRRNGLLASEHCPPEYVTESTYATFPAELKTWARENGWPAPPDRFSPLCRKTEAQTDGWIMIEKPHVSDSFMIDPLVPPAHQKIIFQAGASPEVRQIEWLINGEKVAESVSPAFRFEWDPVPGTHHLTARANSLKQTIQFHVLKPD
jgi:penicillin-binding protein 1C